ncbi:MAG: EAL domain-containing protein, partial [Acidiferrobacteraceae bacterium]
MSHPFRIEPIVLFQPEGGRPRAPHVACGYELLMGKTRPRLTMPLDQWRTWTRNLVQRHAPWALHQRPGWVAINVSTRQLLDDEIYETFSGSLLAPRIVIEWVEDANRNHGAIKKAARRLVRLREQYGFRLAVDDVGDGEDGLGRAALIAPEFLKSSGRLLVDSRNNSASFRVLTGIGRVAHDLGAMFVVEWVETRNDLARAEAAGGDAWQGHLSRKVSLVYEQHAACDRYVGGYVRAS